MAELVSTWTSCARQGRAIGAIIVKDKRILDNMVDGLKKIDGIEDVIRTDI